MLRILEFLFVDIRFKYILEKLWDQIKKNQNIASNYIC